MRIRRAKQLGLAIRGEHADHAAHRVADEDHVLADRARDRRRARPRVAVERRVALGVVRREIRLARAHVVEEHDAVVVLEGGRDEPPHVLIAAEAVREEHGLRAVAEHVHVVAGPDCSIHRRHRKCGE